ncbi:hypothetical protein HDU96_002387 [Phlyctochytrium bullatum]|nr:hypothetical protein HDU96_002387 [Phlyctochytrium bullatum]
MQGAGSVNSEAPLVVQRQAMAFPPATGRARGGGGGGGAFSRKRNEPIPFWGGNRGTKAFWAWFFQRTDSIVFLMAVALIVSICTGHAVLTLPYLIPKATVALPIVFGYLLICTILHLFKTTLMDPGFLPINLHADPNLGISQYSSSAMPPQQELPPLAPIAPAPAAREPLHGPSATSSTNLLLNESGQSFPEYPTSPTPASAPDAGGERETPLPKGYPFLMEPPPAASTSSGGGGGLPRPLIQSLKYQQSIRPVLPSIMKVEINGVEVHIKYCHTCKIWRPPRASHCATCDRCVDNHDHHCPWMANCIGKRNYRHFFGFLVYVSLLDLYVWSATLAHIVLLAKERAAINDAPWSDTLSAQPILVVILVFTTLLMVTFCTMTPFHIWLTLNNLTTHEHLKRRFYYDDPEDPRDGPRRRHHPFHKGSAAANCHYVLCRPLEPSLLPEFLPASLTDDDAAAAVPEGFLAASHAAPPPQPPHIIYLPEDVAATSEAPNRGPVRPLSLPPSESLVQALAGEDVTSPTQKKTA